MTIVVLVVMTETTADILAIGEIVETDVDARRVADGLRADMAATTVAPLFGTFPRNRSGASVFAASQDSREGFGDRLDDDIEWSRSSREGGRTAELRSDVRRQSRVVLT